MLGNVLILYVIYTLIKTSINMAVIAVINKIIILATLAINHALKGLA